MTAETPYARITHAEAKERGLLTEAAERLDSDDVRRAYHQGTQTYWDVPIEPYDPVGAVERAVWGELNKRRWFGKHVDDEAMEKLDKDIHKAVRSALRVDA